MDGEFGAQYLGKSVWSVTKTCPIFSEYNEYWYFYEEGGQLESRLQPPKATKESSEGTQQVAIVSKQSKGQILDELYLKINDDLEHLYLLNQQLQNFDWRSIENLSWASKGDKGNEHITYMLNVLPSKEALQPLLIQKERCIFLTILLWQENPYKKTTDQVNRHLKPVTWYSMNQQLEEEITRAEELAKTILLDTNKKFADIDREINVTGAMSETYIRQIQMKYTEYTIILDEKVQRLEKARLLAVEINHLAVNPSALNVP